MKRRFGRRAQILLEVFGWIALFSAILLIFGTIIKRMDRVNELDSMLKEERFRGISIEKFQR